MSDRDTSRSLTNGLTGQHAPKLRHFANDLLNSQIGREMQKRDIPENLLGLRAEGRLTRSEYETILISSLADTHFVEAKNTRFPLNRVENRLEWAKQ
jgi:hypothetical protein